MRLANAVALLLALGAVPLAAQQRAKAKPARTQQSAQVQNAPLAITPITYDSTLFNALEWRNVGPVRGGRSIAAAGSAARYNEYYFGATGGGLWKTTDGGTTWKPVTDKKIGSSSVGAVAVCEANPDVVYLGMGETELRGNIMQGDGVYKSTDAGKTWKRIGFENSQAIAKIRVSPASCDVVYVAFQHIGILSLEFHVDKLSRPLL